MEKNQRNRDQVLPCQGNKILCTGISNMHITGMGKNLRPPFEIFPYHHKQRNAPHVPHLPTLVVDNSSGSHDNQHIKAPRQPLVILPKTILHIICLVLIISCTIVKQTCQLNTHLCPNVCKCDFDLLEVHCNRSFDASGLPHTLNPSIEKLIINHAQTSQFKGSEVGVYVSLELLDLAYNNLTSIDLDGVKANTRMKTLNLSHNNITDLRDSSLSSILSKLTTGDAAPFLSPDAINDSDEFKKLRKSKINIIDLDLSYNQIASIVNYLFVRWHRLQRLNLSYNSITTLEPESFFGLSKLEHINLRGNLLVQVPALALQETIKSLTFLGSQSDSLMSALKSIDLGENPLTMVGPNSFSVLGQAQTLRLDSCSIQSIDDMAFEGLTSLTTLSLANNDLAEVPSEALRAVGSLRTLYIDANDILTLGPYAFKTLYNLEELYLSNGSIRKIEAHALNGLNSLKKLDLSRNLNLTRIDSTLFDNLPKIAYLNLYMCSLNSLPATEGVANHGIVVLDLRANSLTCDCDLKWLTGQLKRLNETAITAQVNKALVTHLDSHVKSTLLDQALLDELLSLTCSGPPALVGKQVISLPDNKLECIHPSSPMNLRIGFASLFFMILALTTVCLINFCHNEKHLIGILKENIAQNRISMMLPYTQDLHKNVDNLKREPEFECAAYEPVDYGPIYTVPVDQYTSSASSQQQHTHQL